MPIDPNIPLSFRPPQIESPLSLYTNVLNLRAQQQQMESNQIALQKAHQAQDDDNALRAVMRVRHVPGQPTDWDGIVNDLEPVAPQLAMKISETVTDQRIKLGNAKKVEAETLDRNLTTSAQVVAGILDQGTQEGFLRGKAVIAKINPDWAAQLGDTYDENHLREVQAFGTTAKDALDKHKASVDFALKAMELSASAGRDAEARAKNAPEILQHWNAAIGTQAQNITNEADATKMAQTFAAMGEVPKSIIGSIGDVDWKVFKAKAIQLALTPKDVLEAGARGQGNAIAAANLALRQKELNTKHDNATDIAGAIKSGDQPPDLSRLYGSASEVRANLARGGYNLTKAQEDWAATTKYISSMNGPQQLRLRQDIDFTEEALGKVETLAKDWKSGGFGPMSRARLTLASNGTYGPKQQEKATKLLGQIAEVTSSLATVYQGGNSGTDKAIDLARQALQADWGESTLLSNIAQVRENIGYRKNSIRTAGVAGASSDNAYMPNGGGGTAKPSTSGGSGIKVNDTVTVNGKKYKVNKINADGTFDGTEIK